MNLETKKELIKTLTTVSIINHNNGELTIYKDHRLFNHIPIFKRTERIKADIFLLCLKRTKLTKDLIDIIMVKYFKDLNKSLYLTHFYQGEL